MEFVGIVVYRGGVLVIFGYWFNYRICIYGKSVMLVYWILINLIVKYI